MNAILVPPRSELESLASSTERRSLEEGSPRTLYIWALGKGHITHQQYDTAESQYGSSWDRQGAE